MRVHSLFTVLILSSLFVVNAWGTSYSCNEDTTSSASGLQNLTIKGGYPLCNSTQTAYYRCSNANITVQVTYCSEFKPSMEQYINKGKSIKVVMGSDDYTITFNQANVVVSSCKPGFQATYAQLVNGTTRDHIVNCYCPQSFHIVESGGSYKCEKCPDGTTTNKTNQTECISSGGGADDDPVDDPVDDPDTDCGYADGIYTDSGLIQRASLTQDGGKCVLAPGTYYDKRGTIKSENTCSFGCAAGYFYPDVHAECIDCPNNYYCPAGATGPQRCQNAPANAHYTETHVTNSNCPWECNDGFKREGGKCVENTDVCNGGYNIGSGSYSCVDPNTNGETYGYIDHNGYSSDASTYNLMSNGSWGVTFNQGKVIVIGIASCTQGTNTTAFSQTVTGKDCWCKMTSPTTSSWVFSGSFSTTSVCADECASSCGYDVQSSSTFRSDVFSSVGN